MNIAVMQPYFFPYSGYFSLIESVDRFVFFDSVQFNKKSWMMRNRLLNIAKNEAYYIRPNLKKSEYLSMLPSIQLDNSENWKLKIMEQLKGYKNKAPFYFEVESFIQLLFEKEYEFLVSFNIESTIEICKSLGLSTVFDKFSDLNIEIAEIPGEGDWGRIVAQELGAFSYINAPGGESFIFPESFSEVGMKLGFIQPRIAEYNQKSKCFVPGLSIIDLLMFNGFEGALSLIKNYEVKWVN